MNATTARSIFERRKRDEICHVIKIILRAICNDYDNVSINFCDADEEAIEYIESLGYNVERNGAALWWEISW